MTRRRRALLLGAAIALMAVLLVRVLLRPDRVAGFVLAQLSHTLGLDITATGSSDYTLRGDPSLAIRNVVVREPGAATPMLRAQRIFVSVPWSTVRSRGADLAITRIEIYAPRLDINALTHWLSTRPAGNSTMPSLRRGLRVTNARIDGGDWRIESLAIDLPKLIPRAPLSAHARGRMVAGSSAGTFDLHAAMTRPTNDAGIAVVGPVSISANGQRIDSRMAASAPMRFGDDGVRSARLHVSLDGTLRSDAATQGQPRTTVSGQLAITTALSYRNHVLALAPLGIAVRSEAMQLDASAHGAFAIGPRMFVELDGALATWPSVWPALPPPIGQSKSPFTFALRYLGASNFADIANLQLQQDGTRLDAQLRAPQLLAWTNTDMAASPLPPITGRLVTPRIDISGAQLEGVEVSIEDPPTTSDTATP